MENPPRVNPSVLKPCVPPEMEDGGNELDHYKVQLKLATDIISERVTFEHYVFILCSGINVCSCTCMYVSTCIDGKCLPKIGMHENCPHP